MKGLISMTLFWVSLSPILWLIISLSILKMTAWKACTIALLISFIASVAGLGMSWNHAATAALEGVALACWPILLVIIAAIFAYQLSVHTKRMETIKKMLTSVSTDKRVLVLLIGWGFGGFLESMAGFGTSIAIPAGMLAGIGLDPMLAVASCLIANGVSPAYGSIGIPLLTLANVTGIDSVQLAIYTAWQLGVLTILSPFLMVIVAGRSLKALKGMIPMCLVSGLSFFLPELAVSMFMGPELAVVAGSICAMGAIVVCAMLFPVNDSAYAMSRQDEQIAISVKDGFVAWLPFILIFLFLLLTSKLVPVIYDTLNLVKTSVLIYNGDGGAPYTFVWIATPGVLILLAAFIGGTVQGASMGEMLAVLKKTIIGLWATSVTIIAVIATAKVMGYSGMTSTIAATAVGATGTMYPTIAALIGSLGTFITGSVTSSCVLFGKLQTASAMAIGASPNGQAWMAAANAAGACAGKMIAPQNIAIGVAAIGVAGLEGKLLQFAVKIYIPFIIFLGILVYLGQVLVN